MFFIEVPEFNDSISRIILSEKQYGIRFTYNSTSDDWSFSLYDSRDKLIIGMLKIVPLSPLTHYYKIRGMPDGIFGAFTKLNKIGKDDFKNGNAKFAYIPNSELEGWDLSASV